jgi:hypothetical protein
MGTVEAGSIMRSEQIGPEEARCVAVVETPRYCGRPPRQHYPGHGHRFEAPPDEPKSHEIARASAVTMWDCPFCKAPNDVHGEGALNSWMECGECGEDAFLVSEYDS